MNEIILTVFNTIYDKYGFHDVLTEVEDRLTYGQVTQKEDGLYCITTAGFSDDESVVRILIGIASRFGYFHYVGYLRGGAYYFSEHKHDNNIEIIRKE